MPLLRLNRHPSPRQLLVFAVAWALLAGLAGFGQHQHGHPGLALVCWGLALAVPGIGAAWPEGLRLLFVGFSLATYPIGLAVSSTVLALFYYIVMAPVGLVLRLAGYDPLRHRFDRAAGTYWRTRSGRRDPASYFRQH